MHPKTPLVCPKTSGITPIHSELLFGWEWVSRNILLDRNGFGFFGRHLFLVRSGHLLVYPPWNESISHLRKRKSSGPSCL